MIALALALALLAPQETEQWKSLGERDSLLIEVDLSTIQGDGTSRRARLRGTSTRAPGVTMLFTIVANCETGMTQPEGGFDSYVDGEFKEHLQPVPDDQMSESADRDAVVAALVETVCPA